MSAESEELACINARRVTDPSILTTRQLLREISLLEDKINTRFSANEKNFEKLFNSFEKITDTIDRSIGHLNAVHSEKFNSIQTQFRERDTRAEQTSKDSKTAVDAALQAAKEAVSEQNKSNTLAVTKSETATTKQIDQIYTLINASNKATDEKINDIKGRLDQGLGVENGVKATKDDSKAWIAIAISAASVLVILVVGVVQYVSTVSSSTVATVTRAVGG
jgi:hypothetical protein